MTGAGAISRPVLTFPAAEAEAVKEAYATANVVLEYGSGGSTAMAADLPGKVVFSVENDANWLDGLRQWFAASPPRADLRLHGVNTGPVGKWGMPKSGGSARRWPDYALSVWDREDFLHPDVVLVDGRFRAACFLVTAFRITRPVTVLFDDYAHRPAYHEVETVAKPAGLIGRMAVFDLAPQAFPVDRMGWFVKFLTQPA